VCSEEDLGIADLEGAVDFALAFAVVHEVPDEAEFMKQLRAVLRPTGRLLVAEPSGHVTAEAFDRSLAVAAVAGFETISRPKIRRSRAALLAPVERGEVG
jgi:hypothetical protein